MHGQQNIKQFIKALLISQQLPVGKANTRR